MDQVKRHMCKAGALFQLNFRGCVLSANVTASHTKKKTQSCILEVSLNSTVEADMITACTALTPSGPTHIWTLLFSALVMQGEK